ncbi:MAG: hypothetical protein H6704_24370 [Myxococcales bacterium]|nr:hypothetical protein [Myxococcales bacterium]MCB9539361.1 hypothetical protein [Myxococcales bacterium]
MRPVPPAELHALDVEWFRPDPRRRLAAPWAAAVLLVTAGSLAAAHGIHRLHGQLNTDAFALTMLVVGLGAVASGMVLAVASAIWVLSDDTCVGVRVDGVLVRHRESEATLVPWSAVRDVVVRAGRVELITDGTTHPLPACRGVDPATLCERLRAAHRRVLMGVPLRS